MHASGNFRDMLREGWKSAGEFSCDIVNLLKLQPVLIEYGLKGHAARDDIP